MKLINKNQTNLFSNASYFKKDYFYLSIIFLGVFILYSPIINKVFRISWDTFDLFYLRLLYVSDSIHSGVFPLWNPFMLSGTPYCSLPHYNLLLVLISLLP